MKKVTFNRFGGIEVLQLVDAPMPTGDIIVQVKAVSINPLDWKLWQGEMKMMSGRTFPKSVGIDFSGIVVQGNGRFKPGDEVLGISSIFKGSSLAEYLAVKDVDIVHKPAAITFAEAAAMPVVGLAALQIFDKLLTIKPGMQILINGAGGGIGLFAIQLAKKAGAVVTAVVGPAAMEVAARLGSDKVINYRDERILNGGQIFDAVIDLSGKMDYRHAKPLLKRKGIYINTSPGLIEMIASLFSGGRYKLLFLKPSTEYLEKLVKLNLETIIGGRYSFENFRQAFEEVKKGGVVGKAVILL
ncbi:NAD(P)-dependent alcohol dehydrogenase [uncultured Chitinophaga sp.]|uniref:NAD(P)-dependent alcohol dehydrogenase n=1 Tax=uncultured Chitinophaga sp. TaxID=339340 RepID=UPI0025E888B4|nr:NAD(P)-dependent alcohol dehydrogenase [uncultured Chitinophaga sp.]